MYQVGVKEGNWLFITDGLEIYGAEVDLRHYSAPHVSDPGYCSRTNRITRLKLTQAEFAQHCATNNIELRGCETASVRSSPIAVGVIVGIVIGVGIASFGSNILWGGILGALIGAGLTGLMSSSSDFTIVNMAGVFNRAKASHVIWKNYDEQQTKIQLEQEAEYQRVAQERWCRYHRIRNTAFIDELTGIEFEAAVASLYERSGYMVTLTKASGDFGIDVLANKGTELLAIQVKRYVGNVGVRAVQEVTAGALHYKATTRIVITNSFFTRQAKELAKSLGVTLINKKRLANMWRRVSTATSIPPFDIQQYEAMKRDIDRELYRLDAAAGKRRWFPR